MSIMKTGILISMIACSSVVLATDAEKILVFGDSLTWGWSPVEPIIPTVRHANGVDGIHFTAETNRILGLALASEVKQVLSD